MKRLHFAYLAALFFVLTRWLVGGHPFCHPLLFFAENLPLGLTPDLFEKFNSRPFFTS